MFSGCKHYAHVLEIARYADMLLEHARQVSSPVMALASRKCFERDGWAAPIVTAVAEKVSGLRRTFFMSRTNSEKNPLLVMEAMVTTTKPNQ